MLRLITIKGGLTGSAVLEIGNRTTRIELRCRKLRQPQNARPFTVYLASETGVKKVKLDGCTGEAEAINAKAVLIADGEGRIIAQGANGLSEAALNDAKTAVRLQEKAPETHLKTESQSEKANSEATKNAAPAAVSGESVGPASPVTRSILDSARQLFDRRLPEAERKPAVGDTADHGRTAEQNPGPVGAEQPLRADNPFPRTLPGAVWHRREPGGTLYGVASVRGERRELVAVPVGGSAADGAQLRFLRRISGRDGRVYLIYIRRPTGN